MAAIASQALKTGEGVYDLILKEGLLSRKQLDDVLRSENMADPRKVPKP